MQRKLSKNDCLPPKISYQNTVNTVIAKIDNEFICRGVQLNAPTNFLFSLSFSENTINKGDWWGFANFAPFACFARKTGGSG